MVVKDKKSFAAAIRQTKRLGLKQCALPQENSFISDEKKFLMHYIFSMMGTSPKGFLASLEFTHSSRDNLRTRRQRNIDYIRGRQFNELVWDNLRRKWVTQMEYMRRRNMPPLTYNVISKFARSLEGQFRDVNVGNIITADSKDDDATEYASILSVCFNEIKRMNDCKNKDAANFTEMLASGQPVFKILWSTKGNTLKPYIKVRMVNPVDYNQNAGVTDYDFDNLHTEFETHNVSIDQILTNFSDGDYQRGQEIRDGYIRYNGNVALQGSYSSQSFDGSEKRDQTFYSQGMSSYRYYEAWTNVSSYEAITYDPLENGGTLTTHKYQDPDKIRKEVEAENAIRRENAQGMEIDIDYEIIFKSDYVTRKYAVYLTPWAYVLDVRESPFVNGESPYSVVPPDINGEVWGMIEELLNAQNSLDRQIANADAIVNNAAKGIWLIPDTAVPDEYDPEEYLEKLSSSNGAIMYKVRDDVEAEHIPKQLFSNATSVSSNVQQLITLYSGMVDEISGNYGAAQGKSTANTASGYALETQNAGMNVKGVMEKYQGMIVKRDQKILEFMLDGYTAEDYYNITGKEVDIALLRSFKFHIEQSNSTNSPAHRMILEQDLLKLVYDQLMPLDVYFEVSTHPVMIQAKQKYAEWKKKEEENAAMMQQQAAMQGQPQGQPQEAQPTNPQQSTQAMTSNILKQTTPKQPRQ